jgi:hypothetical protein
MAFHRSGTSHGERHRRGAVEHGGPGLYLRTGNLFLVIGIHALQHSGTTVLAPTIYRLS